MSIYHEGVGLDADSFTARHQRRQMDRNTQGNALASSPIPFVGYVGSCVRAGFA